MSLPVRRSARLSGASLLSNTEPAPRPYLYTPLSLERQEIRLINLHPGSPDDGIRFEIFHVPLQIPEELPPNRMTVEQLTRTLPPGWNVHETIEGEYIFVCQHGAISNETSWSHPDRSFPRSSYFPDSRPPGLHETLPQYEALSYTWGMQENAATGYVELPVATTAYESQVISSTLAITRNLESALKHLRHSIKPRTLWVDALCINQLDERERNEQVKRMASIFRLAQRVVVWLGPEENNSKSAVHAIDKIGAQLEITVKDVYLRSPEATKPDWYLQRSSLPYDNKTLVAIKDLCRQRAWFKRLWVLQEIHLANKFAILQCGHDQVSWRRFRRGILCLLFKRDRESAWLRDEIHFLKKLTRPMPHFALGRLLNNMRGQACTDPRDRVYGVLGLTSSGTAMIEPNYAKPVGTVFKDAFLSHLKSEDRLEQLRYCDLFTAMTDNTPSWVPNWTAHGWTYCTHNELCAGISRASYRYLEPGLLEVSGVYCATVKTSTPISWDHQEILREIPSWRRLCVGQPARYVTGQDLDEAFAVTLRMNEVVGRYPAYSNVPTTREWTNLINDYISDDSPDRTVKATHDILDESVVSIVGRTLVTTEDGYIGLGPRSAQRGKQTTIIHGSDTYHYIRRHHMRYSRQRVSHIPPTYPRLLHRRWFRLRPWPQRRHRAPWSGAN